jgi:hypothetical protein
VSVPLLSSDQGEFVHAVALRVVQLLEDRERDRQPAGLVDAATLARLFGVSRSTIYEYADALGGLELRSEGKRTLVRFDVEKAREAWTRREKSEESQPAVVGRTRGRRGTATRSSHGLLPVRRLEP